MGWFKTGYGSIDTAYEHVPKKGPRRVWIPPEQTRRYLFLDEEPTTYWEHNFKLNDSWTNWEPCKVRNGMDNFCAVCHRYPNHFPYFVGLFTVIGLTETTWKKTVKKDGKEQEVIMHFCFQREIFAARLGSKDKPGILKKLQRLKAKNGRHKGMIVDCYRSGKKTEVVGDEFEVVEMLDPGQMLSWGQPQIIEFLEKINANVEPDKRITLDKFMERNPWQPFNFEEIIEPKSNAALAKMLGAPSGGGDESKGNDSGSNDGSDSSGYEGLDEEIPY